MVTQVSIFFCFSRGDLHFEMTIITMFFIAILNINTNFIIAV